MQLPTSHSVLQTENMLRYKNCGLSHLYITQLFILLRGKIIMIKLCNSSTV